MPVNCTAPFKLPIKSTAVTEPVVVISPVKSAPVSIAAPAAVTLAVSVTSAPGSTPVVAPTVKPAAVPVMLVPINVEGVPKFGVTSVGDVPKTNEPVPVSSDITPNNCKDVVDANCDNGLDVKASPPPTALYVPSSDKNNVPPPLLSIIFGISDKLPEPSVISN